MKFSLKGAIGVAALAAALSTPTHAQFTLTSPGCNNGSAMAFMGAIACSGAYSGNLSGNPTNRANVISQINADFGGSYQLLGFSDASPFAFTSNPNTVTQGVLTFSQLMKGKFVVGLKSSTKFSFYQFNGGSTGLASINFTTIGTSVNGQGMAQNLSHAALYQDPNDPSLTTTSVVPEPSTYALMGAGLLAVGFVSRRRRA